MRHADLHELPVSPRARQALADFLGRLPPATRAKMDRVIVFGSAARGEETSSSDIDVLVVWRGSLGEALDTLLRVATEVFVETGIDLSIHPLPLPQFEEVARVRTGFYENVEREGILVEG